MENHIWKKIGRQLDNEWRNLGGNWKPTSGRHLGDNWRPHPEDNWKTTRQRMEKPWTQLGNHHIWETFRRQLGDHIWERGGKQLNNKRTLSLSPSPSDLPARAVQRARWKHAHVALLQQPDWETTSRKPHLGDKWKTIGRPHLYDNWETTGRQVEYNWETIGRHLEDNWNIIDIIGSWETTGRPLGDKVPMPRTLLEEPKIGGHSGRQGGRQTGRHSSGDKGDSGRHTVGDKGDTARDKVGDTVEDNCAHTCQRKKKSRYHLPASRDRNLDPT